MSFTVEPSPAVLDAISACTSTQPDFFWRQICAIFAENPYRFRDVIQRNVDARGRVFYQYYDGIVPLVFTYRVYPPEEEWREGAPGFVPITNAEDPWW